MIKDYKVGDKLKVNKNMATIDGMLHIGEVVKVDVIGFPDKDMRVKDSLGRIWYLDFCDANRIG